MTSSTAQTNVVSRITQCEHEPLAVLPPLKGIENQPLVTLIEATRSLTNLLIDLDDYVKRSLSFAEDLLFEGKDPNGLTKDEIAAINLYTLGWENAENSLYAVLNLRLRLTDRTQAKPFFPYLRLIISGLTKLPKLQIPLYRGVKKSLTQDYVKGRKFYWWGFSSCTTTLGVLQNELFLGKQGNRTMFCLSKSSGVDIQRYSMYKTESEVLLLPERRFVVKDILDQETLQIIQIEEIEEELLEQKSPSISQNITTIEPDEKVAPTLKKPSERHYNSIEMKDWNRTDLSEWLQDIEFNDYIPSFHKNMIVGAMFISLNEEDFKALGITNKFHLQNLLLQRTAQLAQEKKNQKKEKDEKNWEEKKKKVEETKDFVPNGKYLSQWQCPKGKDSYLRRIIHDNQYLYINDSKCNEIYRYSFDGKFINSLKYNAHGMEIHNNHLYLTGDLSLIVVEIKTNTIIQTYDLPKEKDGPVGGAHLKIDHEKFFFTPHFKNSNYIYCMNQNGKEIKRFGCKEKSQKEGEFGRPRGITIDETYLYVCDYENHRLQVVNKENGKFIRQLTMGKRKFNYPQSILLYENFIYIGDINGIQVFTKDTNKFTKIFGSHGSKIGEFRRVTGLCIVNSKLYVVDHDNKRIQVWN